ncbi:MAG: serine/threonine protein kinase [Acidobacteria bacterium]|nr:serine/threonine protein kinase [Acidobacteriota bacterium]
MTQEHFALLEAWFEEASALRPSDRDSVYLTAQKTAPELADELRRMMSAFDEEATGGKLPSAYVAPAFSPRRFGPWLTERLLGRGGMGSVFLASRADGQYVRQVALKALAPYLADDSFQQRFLSERRILATLNHPNIARMLDGGVTEDGTPYLVMEYVEGDSIRAYCDKHCLTITERVHLFLQVCSAVSYAHQRLVLHRDLKPSNIMVTGAGVVHLLDFGAALLLSPSGAEMTLTGSGLMTPRYASPEQMRQQPVGTPSDIYSLGVVLYEILAGTGPFGDDHSPLEDFLRLAENRSPSPLGETLGENAATLRNVSDAALRRTLRGEYRLIVAKCLQPDPRDRYQTADALILDLRAVLENRPVSARPPTAGYRAAKFVRRHVLGVAFSVTAILALAAGSVAIAWQSRIADKRFQEVRSLAHYQAFELFDGLEALAGSRSLRQDLVERSMTYLDALSRDTGNDLSLKEELAEGYLRLGDLYTNSGFAAGPRRNALAKEAYDKGKSLAQGLNTPSGRRILAMLEMNSGMMAINTPKAEVKAAAEKAYAAVQRAIEQSPNEPKNYIYLGNILSQSGEKLRSAGGMLDGSPDGLPNFKPALEAYRRAQQLGADSSQVQRLIWTLNSREAFVLSSTNPDRAIDLAQASLKEIAAAQPAVRSDARIIRIQSQFYSHIGWAGGQALRFDLAVEASNRCAELLLRLLDQDPANPRILYDLSGAYRALGIVETYAKHPRQAIAAFEKAISMHNAILAGGPSTQSEFLRAELTGRISDRWDSLGERTQAAAAARQAEAWLRKLCEVPNANPSYLYALTNLLAENAYVKNPADALRFAQQARKLQPSPLNDQAVVRALILNGRLDEADQLLKPLEAQAHQLSESKDSRLRQVLQTMRDELERRRRATRPDTVKSRSAPLSR